MNISNIIKHNFSKKMPNMTKRRHCKDLCPTEPRYFTAILCPWHGPRNEQMKQSTKYVVLRSSDLGIGIDWGSWWIWGISWIKPVALSWKNSNAYSACSWSSCHVRMCFSVGSRVEVSNRNSASSQRTVATPEGCRSAFRVIWNSSMSFCSRVLSFHLCIYVSQVLQTPCQPHVLKAGCHSMVIFENLCSGRIRALKWFVRQELDSSDSSAREIHFSISAALTGGPLSKRLQWNCNGTANHRANHTAIWRWNYGIDSAKIALIFLSVLELSQYETSFPLRPQHPWSSNVKS